MELIKVQDIGGRPGVDARELHSALGVSSRFNDWIASKIEKYGFEEGQDFYSENSKSTGGRPGVEYALSLDMAKELAMVENNEKGKEVRRYFIEIEKRYREDQPKKLTGQALVATALIEANKMLEQQAAQIEAMKPAAQFYADVAGSRDAIPMSQAAKIIGMGVGRNSLFQILRDNGVLMANNEPYQKYIDNRWFRVVEQKYTLPDGEVKISIKTLVYQKGIEGIIKLIRSQR